MQANTNATGTRSPGANQGLLLIALGSLVTLAIVSLVPNLPQMLKHFSDVPNYQFYVPMIITVPSLCIAIVSPFAGALADFWGRRRLMLVALALYGTVGMLPLLSDNLFTVIATRFGVGIAEAAILTCGNALMGDYFSGAERHKWLGYQATLGTVIASCMMLAGGKLGTISWQGPFALYGLGLLLLVWAAFALFEPRGQQSAQQPTLAATTADEPGTPFPWPATILTSVVTLGVATVYFVQAIQLGRMFSELGVDSPARISVFTTIASLGVLAGGFSFRYVATRGIGQVIAIVLATMGLGYVGVSLSPNAYVGLPFAFLAQFANGMTLPALLGWTMGKYSYSQRGRGMGIWGSCFFLATFISPPLVTLITSATGALLKTVMLLGLVCFAVALVTWFKSRGGGASLAAAGTGH
jgi:MFS family permease